MTRFPSLRCALGATAILLSPTTAYAAEWYVDQTATAGGDGSSAHPFQTINAAKDVMSTGDTVWIQNGVYSETLNFYDLPGPHDASHRTTVSAAQGATSVVVDGGGSEEYVIQAATPYMTFRGLTVRNGGTEGFQFYGCRPGDSCGLDPADYGEVINCRTESVSTGVVFYFTGHGRVEGSDIYGGIAGKGSDGTIVVGSQIHHSVVEGLALHDDSKNCKYLNNVIYDNQRPNIYLDSASYMTVDGNVIYMTGDPPEDNAGIQMADETYAELTAPVMSNITITNNVIFNNYDGIYFWDSGMWNGQSGMKNVTIANNTIINNKNRGLFWDSGAHQNTIIRNNIIAQNGVGNLLLFAHSTTGITLDHNLWFMPSVAEPFGWGGSTTDHANWVSSSGQGAADVVADPGFLGTWLLPASNFMLAATSPAIDVGTSDVAIPTNDHTLDHDFALAARPAGSAIDLGAFEYGSTASPDAGNPALDASGAGGTSEGGSTGNGGSSPGNGGSPGVGGSAQGGQGQAGADGGTAPAAAEEDSGCSCRAAGMLAGADTWPLWIAIAGVVSALRNRSPK